MQSDEMLARSIQQGNVHDLKTLVERYHGPLLGYFYRLSNGDGPLAEDLTQETFLRVLRKIHQYRHSQRFKPWLYAIATNMAHDHHKRLSTRMTTAMPDSIVDYPENDSPQSPEKMIVVYDEVALVRKMLAMLPDHQREVVLLRYIEEMSLIEIGAALGIPVGTVKSRLSLGLKRMRAMMAEEEVDG